MTAPPLGCHRAPPDDLRRIRVLYVAAVAVLLGGVIGTAQAAAPHAVTSAPLPREPEPRPHPHYARPVIPVIGDPAAPHYEPVSAPSRAASVNTPPGQRAAAPRPSSAATGPGTTTAAAPTPDEPAQPEPVAAVIPAAPPVAPPEEEPVTEAGTTAPTEPEPTEPEPPVEPTDDVVVDVVDEATETETHPLAEEAS